MQDLSSPGSLTPAGASVRRPDAFDLLSALASYEAAAGRLAESWFDTQVYARIGKEIDAIRAHAVMEPALTVVALQLVIAHHELVSALWERARDYPGTASIEAVRERHRIAVHVLRVAAAAVSPGQAPAALL